MRSLASGAQRHHDTTAVARDRHRHLRRDRHEHAAHPPIRPSLPLPGSHQGLIGLKERAELLGGTSESGPTTDGGYEVNLRIPTHAD